MNEEKQNFPAAPVPPFSVESIAWEEWNHGEHFGSRVRRLVDSAQGAHIGVVMEELPAGKQSCPFHYHMMEEEHVLVLEGQMTLRLGEKTHELKAGDYVHFPAAQKLGHCFVNNGAETCRFLCFGERNPNDVVVYPDSGKVLVRQTHEIYRKMATMDYWEGEK